MSTSHVASLAPPSTSTPIRLSYTTTTPPPLTTKKGTILLLHGFPQTSHQFRHVSSPLSAAGYHIITPDYRGAGRSSKPSSGYNKSQMAEDIHDLLHTHLSLTEKVHIIGHDIGGMIAWTYAAKYPDNVASLIWGECPLPGSTLYEQVKASTDVFHFVFHQVPDLPEALIAGREEIYIKHFFDKQCARSDFYSPEDLEHYVQAYRQPGAMRAALDVYRAFETDAEENRVLLRTKGQVMAPTLGMFGKEFLFKERGEDMVREVCGGAVVEMCQVEGSGHYVAEEAPEKFVEHVLGFVGRFENTS